MALLPAVGEVWGGFPSDGGWEKFLYGMRCKVIEVENAAMATARKKIYLFTMRWGTVTLNTQKESSSFVVD